MSNTERITAKEYRDSLKRPLPPLPAPPRLLFAPEVYMATSGTYIIEVEPMGAPRTTRNSRFNPSKANAIDRYVLTTTKIREDCMKMGYQLGAVLKVRFEITMPASWSEKKKSQFAGLPHQSKPDLDNMVKLVCDAFKTDDSHVHTIHATKIWARAGRIIITR